MPGHDERTIADLEHHRRGRQPQEFVNVPQGRLLLFLGPEHTAPAAASSCPEKYSCPSLLQGTNFFLVWRRVELDTAAGMGCPAGAARAWLPPAPHHALEAPRCDDAAWRWVCAWLGARPVPAASPRHRNTERFSEDAWMLSAESARAASGSAARPGPAMSADEGSARAGDQLVVEKAGLPRVIQGFTARENALVRERSAEREELQRAATSCLEVRISAAQERAREQQKLREQQDMERESLRQKQLDAELQMSRRKEETIAQLKKELAEVYPHNHARQCIATRYVHTKTLSLTMVRTGAVPDERLEDCAGESRLRFGKSVATGSCPRVAFCLLTSKHSWLIAPACSSHRRSKRQRNKRRLPDFEKGSAKWRLLSAT